MRFGLPLACPLFLAVISLAPLGCSSPAARTVSAEAPSESKALRDQINDRFFSTKLPEFLASRRNEEGAYAGADLPVEDARALLASDAETVPGKISAVVNPDIYSSLQHQMGTRWLMATLKAGQLVPRKADYGNNSEEESTPGVYLELHLKAQPKPFAWGDVELHFDYALLDRDDYFVNAAWEYGEYSPNSASPAVNKGRVAYFVRSFLPKGEQNEIVFVNPVSLSLLSQIVVPTGKRAALLAQVRQAKLRCPVAAGWAALIVEQARPPKPK